MRSENLIVASKANEKQDRHLADQFECMNLSLHVDNDYQIQFTALDFAPKGDLNPCQDLGKVEYVESADESVKPRVLAVELHK